MPRLPCLRNMIKPPRACCSMTVDASEGNSKGNSIAKSPRQPFLTFLPL